MNKVSSIGISRVQIYFFLIDIKGANILTTKEVIVSEEFCFVFSEENLFEYNCYLNSSFIINIL